MIIINHLYFSILFVWITISIFIYKKIDINDLSYNNCLEVKEKSKKECKFEFYSPENYINDLEKYKSFNRNIYYYYLIDNPIYKNYLIYSELNDLLIESFNNKLFIHKKFENETIIYCFLNEKNLSLSFKCKNLNQENKFILLTIIFLSITLIFIFKFL